MGQDMIIYTTWYPREGFTPDWAAGEALIKSLAQDQNFLDEYCYDDDSAAAEEDWLAKLEEFKEAYCNGRRDMARYDMGPITVIMTGGPSWGDSPTELADLMGDLEQHEILIECGFENEPDWKKMFQLTLEKAGSKVLPKLIGLDPHLDEIVKQKLKGD